MPGATNNEGFVTYKATMAMKKPTVRVRYNARTACSMCGNHSLKWFMEIDPARGNTPWHIDEQSWDCRRCGHYMEPEVIAHTRIIEQTARNFGLNEITDMDALFTLLERVSNEHNEQQAKIALERKPDADSGTIITTRQHKRYRTTGVSGTECSNCKNIVLMDPRAKIRICPACGHEHGPKEDLLLIEL